MNKTVAIVLAAGKGTRMDSDLPKVLVEVCGRPMVEYVLEALAACGVDETFVVVGYRADDVRQTLGGWPNVTFVEQPKQLGTGHAVMMCEEHLAGFEGPVLVVTGDSPMIQADSVKTLFAEFEKSQPACLLGTAHRDDPHGLGRIVRDAQGVFVGIVEEKDATPEQRRITEVNMSTYVFNCRDLLLSLKDIGRKNTQKEYYLTDCPGVLLAQGRDVRALPVLKPVEALSVNTPADLAVVEQAMRASAHNSASNR